MTAPTPETHRYVGMWRPPFEVVCPKVGESAPACNCGARLPLREEILDHWLAGHFDEPQYEAKERHAGAPKPYTVRWHLQDGRTGTTEVFKATSAEDAIRQATMGSAGAPPRELIIDEAFPAESNP